MNIEQENVLILICEIQHALSNCWLMCFPLNATCFCIQLRALYNVEKCIFASSSSIFYVALNVVDLNT